MAIPRDLLQILVELLTPIFGQFPAPPLNPDKRATEKSTEKECFEVYIPVSSGKMTFAAEERPTETIFRLALSEETIAAGLFEKAHAWAEAAERKIPEKFPKLEKGIKIIITEMRANGSIIPRHVFTIDARKR